MKYKKVSTNDEKIVRERYFEKNKQILYEMYRKTINYGRVIRKR